MTSTGKLMGAVVILALLFPSSALAGAPVLHLRRFSSPDQKVTCVFFAGAVICGSSEAPSDDGSHNGLIAPNEVEVCNHSPGGSYCNGNSHTQGRAPALPDGRIVEVEEFRCVSEKGGIACILTSGRLAGRGFWIDRRHAVKIRRPVPAKTPPPVAPGGTTQPELWSALGGKVTCGIAFHTPGPARYLLCEAGPIPAPTGVDPSLGDPGWVYLEATGPPKPALISQYSWQVGMNETRVRIPELAAGTTWSSKPIGITCSIAETAVVCVNRSGHGFTLTADNYTEQ